MKQLEWISQKNRLKEIPRTVKSISESGFYQFFSLLFWSHITRMFIETSIMVFSRLGLLNMSKAQFQIMIAALSAVSSILDGAARAQWAPQRDKTEPVLYFECMEFRIRKSVVFVASAYQFLTLDDELMGKKFQSDRVNLI